MKYLIFIALLFSSVWGNGQSKRLPKRFYNVYYHFKLFARYDLTSYIKPAFLEADLNGDGVTEIATLITDQRTHKKGIMLADIKNNKVFIFGAGIMVGKKGFDGSDDLKWMDGWVVYSKKIAYETTFNNGDITGSVKRQIPNKGIYIWANQDGSPLAGGIIYWDGKKYDWIHQGE